MQTFIDFLVNNYLWFIIISFILIFALIGYLVDTNEKKNKEMIEDNEVDAPVVENIKVEDTTESANMDMGIEEKTLQKDVISVAEEPLINNTPVEEKKEETEVLDI